MPLLIDEKIISRIITTGRNPRRELHYVLRNETDEEIVKAGLEAEVPLTYGGLVFTHVEISPVSLDVWDGIAHYASNQLHPQVGDSVISFDTTGGTQHITNSKSTVSDAFNNPNPPDFGGAIGVTDNGIEGTDIVIAVFKWTVKRIFAEDYVNNTYVGLIALLTGTVNDAPFWGFAAGEVLFMGARGSKSETGWEMEFEFAASPNRSIPRSEIYGSVVAGGTLDKGGWQYLWTYTRRTEDEDAFTLSPRPIAAYVQTVYDYRDFSLLGIGT